MGCASSKQKKCRRCNAPYSPAPRSYSMHVHHPPLAEGDSYHVVALTSTTLGTLKLNSPAPTQNFANCDHDFKLSNGKVGNAESFRFDSESFVQRLEEKEKEKEKKSEVLEKDKKEEFSMGLIEAKTWSNMIEQKLPKVFPKTPIRTPPGEPETINTWELMEGLEDTTTPFRSPSHFRSFSFDFNGGDDVGVGDGGVDVDVDVDVDPPKMSVVASPKPMWLLMTEEESRLNPEISDFDPEVISSFRKSLQQLSPDSPFHLQPAPPGDEEDKHGTKKGSSFEENEFVVDDVKVDDPCGKDKVVLYFTSLRGVRKTYEDCCQVRMILKGLGVRVDERDVSMHSGFKEELKELLCDGYGSLGLPRVFLGGNYIGGAEEIQRLHEDGKLEKLLVCCEKIEDSVGGDGGGGVCEACGDIRFVPCETCCGSCKIYYTGDEEDEEEYVDGEVGECGFQRCPDCNENGLIRCPMCCC
ncbi:uncharacterized protein At3g28850-like [Glycine soja]|uniref:Glutaredoxin domain-containing protein n=1 Tax=Glycine soja TaxID=3848 RepID=A0A445FXU9_GLYSO|nr:uncharacterized protein At3g28850-like [Glycine soja]RZB53731.1 hypothetical protein D0Y65_049607 [Glycine soja]